MTGGESIGVLVVDDHPVYRDGLRHLLLEIGGFGPVAEAADGEEALVRLAETRVDVVLMDIHMPRMGGVPAIATITADHPGVHVLVLTTFDNDRDIHRAIQAGATGYLLKDASREELVRAVRAAAAGESVLAPSVARRLMGRFREPAPEPLTDREIELLALVAGGATNREAAGTLFVSEATVKAYLLRVYQKLGARDRASAVAEAYRRGLLS